MVRIGQWAWFLAIPWIAFTPSTSAQEVIPDFYKGSGIEPNRSQVSQSFNEHIDPFNGSLQLHYVDIHVPGNGGFDLQVTRSYNSSAVNELNPGAHVGTAGIGWTVHFGRVIYKSTVGPCGGTSFIDVLNSPVLELPDGSTQVLVRSSTAGATLLSAHRWRAECNGLGMVVYSPQGVRYEMTQAVGLGGSPARTAVYATRIVDRNNNAAAITYTQGGSPEVASVVTTEGHRIDFTYLALSPNEQFRRISSITSKDGSGDKTFSYAYQAVGGTFSGFQLTAVTRPDQRQWQYQYNGSLAPNAPGGFQLRGVTHPQGGTIAYSYGLSPIDYVQFDGGNPQSRTSVVKGKTTSDGGVWSFNYAPGSLGRYDVTTVTTPGGTITYQHIGPNYAVAGSLWMVGLLMQKQIGALQTETYTWAPQQISSQQYKRPGIWQNTRVDLSTNAPLLTSRSIVRDGATYATSYSGFDVYGNPGTVAETGPNGGSRTTTLGYYTNAGLWIVKQVRDQAVSGGVQITRGVDGVGNVTRLTRDGVQTLYELHPHGGVRQVTLPRGRVHTYPTHKRGIPLSESQPEGISISRAVSDSGNVLTETSGRGYTSTYTYDGLNRVTRIAPATGNATVISYGQSSKVATRGALTESTVYDGFGRPTSVTLGGIVRAYRYDALGRLTFVSNPGASIGTSFTHDALDRVRDVTNADGTTQTAGYGAGSKSMRNERNFTTTYSYRSYGDPDERHLVSITAPEPSANVAIARNGRDQVLTISQGGFTRTYGYDTRGFLTSVDNPETGRTTYGRDDAENMTSRSVGGSTTTFAYDGHNRLTSITYPAGTPAVTKTYTKTHKLETVASSVAIRSYGYDFNDNLTNESMSIDGLNFSLEYEYNGNDQLTKLTYPGSQRAVSYFPDALGRPTQISNVVSAISYWPSGQVNQITYQNGTASVYGQNSRLWPSSFQTSKGAVAYSASTYTYDGVGNLSTVADGVDGAYSRTLGYDAIDRVTSAAGPWGSGTIAYDGAGNLRSQTFGGVALSYSYSSTTNRLNGVSGPRAATYAYDSLGNITGTGAQRYAYDAAPNMTCANCDDPATAVLLQYDGLNKRVSTSRAGIKTYEFYGFNGDLLVEFTPNRANRLAEHIYLGGRRIATIGPAPTSIALPAARLTAVAGQAVTLTATIAGGTTPTGTVTFFDGSTSLGVASVTARQAAITTTFQSVGQHVLTATYSGDGVHFGSSTTATATVLSASTVSGPAGGQGYVAIAGKQTTLSATVNGNSPTGTISFYSGSTLLGTATLAGGTGSISTTLPSPGVQTITIVYSGDANNGPSTVTVSLTVRMSPEQLLPILQLLLED